MISRSLLLLFLATTIPIVCFPGPSVAFILTNSVQKGRALGLACVLGVEIGYLVHVFGAVVGVSAVIAASAQLFTIVKLAGAAWLLWLAWKAFRSRKEGTLAQAGEGARGDLRPLAAFRSGLLVGALNPKTAVFFLAFLPQFVSADAGPVPVQLLIFGLLFIALASIPDTLWALAGGFLRTLTPRLRLRSLDRAAGVVYCVLAAFAITTTARA
ncbi:LysE family translocator [Micromonospora sp. NPDC049204]|uniref:LysE family translocator n=1 Tax=Micromonospora sp. NPDC049204 TaxID=3154351 RepID=UPI0033FD5242